MKVLYLIYAILAIFWPRFLHGYLQQYCSFRKETFVEQDYALTLSPLQQLWFTLSIHWLVMAIAWRRSGRMRRSFSSVRPSVYRSLSRSVSSETNREETCPQENDVGRFSNECSLRFFCHGPHWGYQWSNCLFFYYYSYSSYFIYFLVSSLPSDFLLVVKSPVGCIWLENKGFT